MVVHPASINNAQSRMQPMPPKTLAHFGQPFQFLREQVRLRLGPRLA